MIPAIPPPPPRRKRQRYRKASTVDVERKARVKLARASVAKLGKDFPNSRSPTFLVYIRTHYNYAQHMLFGDMYTYARDMSAKCRSCKYHCELPGNMIDHFIEVHLVGRKRAPYQSGA